MNNTDSVWKRRMRLAADQPDRADTGYWLSPFRNFKADCPYMVGAYGRIADVLVRLMRRGIDVFVSISRRRRRSFSMFITRSRSRVNNSWSLNQSAANVEV
jgi:hypothetical protein